MDPSRDELTGRTVSRFRVVEKLGGGGMGVVYRAEDLRLHRSVALKFLPRDLTSDAEARERFTREAEAASALDHPAICTIHDIGETDDGQLFIAMTLYDGETLKRRIASGPLGVDEVLDIAADIADGLSRAHERGIVHRDIKPANLMLTSSGRVKILDFGLAKLAGRADLTRPGMAPGTASYMAPEQVTGASIDDRADVWALGVVVHEMLTGRNPFDREQTTAALAATLAVEPARLDRVRADVPHDLAILIAEAMGKEPGRRPAARKFAARIDAIRARRRGETARTARHWRGALVAAVVVILGGAGVVIQQARARTTRVGALESLPRIAELARAGRFAEAYPLAMRATGAIPQDTLLAQLIDDVSDVMTIVSDPPGARVHLTRFEPGGAAHSIDAGTTPIHDFRVTRGDWIVRLTLDGYAPVERTASSELLRVIPSLFGGGVAIEEEFRLLPASAVPLNMTFVPGGRYELVSHAAPRNLSAELDDYFIDRFEVTNEDYLEFVRAGGYANRDWWQHPFVRGVDTLSWEAGIAMLVDASGLPGPRSWVGGQPPGGLERHPVTDITLYEAAAYAAYAGKSLPTLYQWEKAARAGMIAIGPGVMMPWGYEGPGTSAANRANFASTGTVSVDTFAFGMSHFGAYAMAGNVREWTSSAATGGHLATGGSWKDPAHLFNAIGVYGDGWSASDLGFRCVRPARADAVRNGGGRIDMAHRTPTYEPVDEATFRTLLTHYRYDRVDLHAQIIDSIDGPDWTRLKVAYDRPAGERVLAYLYLPHGRRPPWQTLVFVPGASVFVVETAASASEWALGPLIRSGRAVFTVVLEGMIERPFEPGYVLPDPSSVAFRDQMVSHAIELRRGLDYLETRSDIDMTRLAYVGLSFGSGSRLVFAGVDDRFRAVIFMGGGIDERLQPTLPEASNINFAPYIRAPKLLLNGTTDDEHPWLTRGLPLWNLLREPKELVLVEGAGHVPPPQARVPAISKFLESVFGPLPGMTNQ